MPILESSGQIVYDTNRVFVLVDPELTRFYHSLIPKGSAIRPGYSPHITVVRSGKEPPPQFRPLEGLIIFQYSPIIWEDEKYYWLNCWSEQIVYIRRQLGLPTYRMNNCYHITLGIKHG